MKTAGVVENSGHCVYSIGFFKLLFAVSLSDLYIYIYMYIDGIHNVYIHCVYHLNMNPIYGRSQTNHANFPLESIWLFSKLF